MTEMDTSLFREFAKLVYDLAGIKLNDGKQALVQARVAKRLRALGIDDPRDYLDVLKADEKGEEIIQFLDVISTNFTHFFREPDHFAVLEQALRQWHEAGQRRFRIWCAASSTGEEPYAIAMVAHYALGDDVDLRILATDISTRVLGFAQHGCYAPDRVKSLPRELQQRYLDHVPARGDMPEHYAVKPVAKALLSFCRLNLARPPFTMKGPFDFVFCRNVMIYFDGAVRGRLIHEVERLMRPAGILVVGHAESLAGVTCGLQSVRPSVYRKPLNVETGRRAVIEAGA